MSQDKPKLALALSYGGAKGLAHIGVLQVLQEAGYHIGRIAGTSAGAIVGAMFAETLDSRILEERFRELIASNMFQNHGLSKFISQNNNKTNFWEHVTCRIRDTIALYMAQSKLSLLTPERYVECLEMLIRIRDFKDCHIPFLSVATNITSGQEFPLCAGQLIHAVLASSSIPGFLPPVDMDGVLLSDGAICCPVPVKYAQDSQETEPTITVAVSVTPKLNPNDRVDNAMDIMVRAEEINLAHLCRAQAAGADVVIEPDTKDVGWNELSRLDEMLESGRQAALEALPRIDKAVEDKHSWWHRLRHRG